MIFFSKEDRILTASLKGIHTFRRDDAEITLSFLSSVTQTVATADEK